MNFKASKKTWLDLIPCIEMRLARKGANKNEC